MFRGVQHITMDAKGRIAMPAKARERLPEACRGQLIATINVQAKCLLLYTLEGWEQVEKSLQELPTLKPEVARVVRLIRGYARDLEFDNAGRFLLPSELRAYAQIEKKVVLSGQGRRFELWSEELWNREFEQVLADVSSGALVLPDELLSLTTL